MNRSFHLPRVWSNSVLSAIAPLFDGSVINVSGWDDRDKEGSRYRSYFSRASEYSVSNYTGERGLDDSGDVTDLEIDLEEPIDRELIGKYDVVFNHTTLEHVFHLPRAFRTLCELSRDIVIVIVPFAQELHFTTSYGDYWRLTPMSVRRLFEANGLEVVFEAASPHRNAGIYLLMIGSRNPQRWRKALPSWAPIETLGGWIGSTAIRRLRALVGRMLRSTSPAEGKAPPVSTSDE